MALTGILLGSLNRGNCMRMENKPTACAGLFLQVRCKAWLVVGRSLLCSWSCYAYSLWISFPTAIKSKNTLLENQHENHQ